MGRRRGGRCGQERSTSAAFAATLIDARVGTGRGTASAADLVDRVPTGFSELRGGEGDQPIETGTDTILPVRFVVADDFIWFRKICDKYIRCDLMVFCVVLGVVTEGIR